MERIYNRIINLFIDYYEDNYKRRFLSILKRCWIVIISFTIYILFYLFGSKLPYVGDFWYRIIQLILGGIAIISVIISMLRFYMKYRGGLSDEEFDKKVQKDFYDNYKSDLEELQKIKSRVFNQEGYFLQSGNEEKLFYDSLKSYIKEIKNETSPGSPLLSIINICFSAYIFPVILSVMSFDCKYTFMLFQMYIIVVVAVFIFGYFLYMIYMDHKSIKQKGYISLMSCIDGIYLYKDKDVQDSTHFCLETTNADSHLNNKRELVINIKIQKDKTEQNGSILEQDVTLEVHDCEENNKITVRYDLSES